MQREQLEFGRGHFVGAIMEDPTFFDISPADQARILGWADGCLTVEELIEERGGEAMRDRYGSINFWFGEIGRLVQEVNFPLYEDFNLPIRRLPNEPIGKHEDQSIPDSAHSEIPPSGRLAGYALSRLFIEQIGLNQDVPRLWVQQRMVRGMDIVEEAATRATTPLELLALTAAGILDKGDVDPLMILKQVFSRAWQDAHNSDSTMTAFKSVVHDVAPGLHFDYKLVGEKQRARLGIA